MLVSDSKGLWGPQTAWHGLVFFNGGQILNKRPLPILAGGVFLVVLVINSNKGPNILACGLLR